MKSHFLSRGAAILALVSLPVGAFAQTAAPASAAGVQSTETQKSMAQNVDAHIAALHVQLQITPAEEGQWSQFAQVMRDNASAMDAAFSSRGQALQTMNAVQDLQSYAQIAQIQSDNMQKLATAFQTLYADFPAAQQKMADQVFRMQKFKHLH